jgi:hypothetical protein
VVHPLDNVLCLDFEASAIGVGSYPIEVAVVDCSSAECHSWMIRPTERWLSHGAWSDEAAAVHGLTLPELVELGLPAQQVAREVSACCDRKSVLCDGGEHERRWLAALYATTDVARLLNWETSIRLRWISLFSLVAGPTSQSCDPNAKLK